MKDNNKKWFLLGTALLLVTLIVCLIVSNKPSNNLKIEGVEQNVITGGSKVKIKMLKPTDTKTYASANKTLQQLYSASNFGSITLTTTGNAHTRDMYWMFKTDGGIWVYCIELGRLANISQSGYTQRPVATTSSFWNDLNNFQKEAIKLTTIYGFPNKKRNGYTDDLQYLATQTLIWEIQQKWRTDYNATPSNTTLYNKFITKNSDLKAVYDSIVTDLRNHGKISSFAATTQTQAPTTTLIYNTNTKKYEAVLTDNNGILSNSDVECPTGFTCTKSENKLVISTNSVSSSAKTIKLTKKMPSAQSQGMLIVDNNSDQRMVLGKANVDNVIGYVKIATEPLGTITIKKTSEDGAKEGFTFEVTGPNNYKQTFKTNAEGIITISNLKLGTYKITETNIPDRYESNSAQSVTLNTTSTTSTKAFYNTLKNTSSVQVIKVDKETNEHLKGAVLVLKKGLVDVVEQWTTDGSAHTIKEKLDINQTYSVCEIIAPDGYKATERCESFKLSSKDERINIRFENEKTQFTVKKVNEDNKPLAGAHLQIVDSKGEVVADWVTDSTGQKTIKGLVFGKTYKLKELAAPDGYVKASDDTFIPSSVVTSKTIKNKQNKVSISKAGSEGKELLAGAHLKLLDENGDVVDSWVTENGETKHFYGLPAGNYTIVEEVAPDGYSKAKDLDFTIPENKDKIDITMYDDPTEVIFSKVSFTSGKEIAGAHLQVKDSEGKIIEEWVSEQDKNHIIKGKLIDGETYTLTETIAPNGYAVSESISFTVGSNDKIVMKNKLTEVRIFKKDTVSGKNVVGARLQLLDPEGKIVREWDTTEDSYIIEGLATGVEYTLKEIKTPENYLQAADVSFILASNEESKDVIMYDTPIVYVDNTADNASIIAVVAGVILVLGGFGTVIWMKKKKA